MALYTILFGVSIFLIILVLTVIRKMFFDWKAEHKIEGMLQMKSEGRPAVSILIYNEKCVVRRRQYAEELNVYDVLTKSDTSLRREDEDLKEEDKKLCDFDNDSCQKPEELDYLDNIKQFNET